MNVSVTIHNKLKYSTSHNVIGVLKGSANPGEYIIYTAHWDHFGIGKPDAKGDSIYNGAVDNGDGCITDQHGKSFRKRKRKTEALYHIPGGNRRRTGPVGF